MSDRSGGTDVGRAVATHPTHEHCEETVFDAHEPGGDEEQSSSAISRCGTPLLPVCFCAVSVVE